MNKLSTLVAGVVTLASFGLTATASADTITEFVIDNAGDYDNNRRDYDLLLNAVVAAELGDILGNPDVDLTVFAPNDGAFYRTARELGYPGGYDEEAVFEFYADNLPALTGLDLVSALQLVLGYHVVEDRVSAFDFIILSFFGAEVETFAGPTFRPRFLSIVDNDPDLRNARLRFPLNVFLENGIVHTISRVLIPADL